MRTVFEVKRIESPDRPLQTRIEMVHADGNAGLWVFTIGCIGTISLSLPWMFYMARVVIPWKHLSGEAWMVFNLRDIVTIDIKFGPPKERT